MRIIETKDYNDMSKKAANILSAQVIMNRIVYWDWQQVPHRSVHMRSW